MSTSVTPEQLERLAHKRAKRKMGWYIHLLVFLCVNTGLALIADFHGHAWTHFPAWGWSIGLVIHGLVVFVGQPGSGLHQRLLDQERRVLAGHRHD